MGKVKCYYMDFTNHGKKNAFVLNDNHLYSSFF
jgi:hypothetical protein